jgi:hypothetical protein
MSIEPVLPVPGFAARAARTSSISAAKVDRQAKHGHPPPDLARRSAAPPPTQYRRHCASAAPIGPERQQEEQQ